MLAVFATVDERMDLQNILPDAAASKQTNLGNGVAVRLALAKERLVGDYTSARALRYKSVTVNLGAERRVGNGSRRGPCADPDVGRKYRDVLSQQAGKVVSPNVGHDV